MLAIFLSTPSIFLWSPSLLVGVRELDLPFSLFAVAVRRCFFPGGQLEQELFYWVKSLFDGRIIGGRLQVSRSQVSTLSIY